MSLLKVIRDYETKILTYMNEGQFENDKFLPRPPGLPGFGPTYNYPLVQLEQALIPLGFYFLMVFFGLLFMRENRQLLSKELVYNLKFVYNFVQIFLCGYMTVEAILLKYRNGLSLILLSHNHCVNFDPVNPPLQNLLWLFYVSKVLDFLDTFFIIVCGKTQQFSFLHIYHHISIYSVYWVNVNLAYDGEIVGTIIFNGFVHTIMYSYYLVSMHTDNVWWKKYMTQIQIIQFVLMITNGTCIYLANCAISSRVCLMYIIYISSLLILFLRFYVASYLFKGSSSSKPKPKTQ